MDLSDWIARAQRLLHTEVFDKRINDDSRKIEGVAFLPNATPVSHKSPLGKSSPDSLCPIV
jgi:hypothetical protein